MPLMLVVVVARVVGKKCDPCPPGFRSLTSRIDKYNGKYIKVMMALELWLLSFTEATNDCRWSNQQRVCLFSLLITGPSKSLFKKELDEVVKVIETKRKKGTEKLPIVGSQDESTSNNVQTEPWH